jgi:integrase/recombinase XerD
MMYSGSSLGQAGMFDRGGIRKYLNSAERRAFLRATRKVKDPYCKVFLQTLFHTGCRISEALNVLAAHVDLTNNAVTFETMKRRKKGCFRAVPVPDKLTKVLDSLSEGKPPSERLWKFSRPTAYRLVKETMNAARISGSMACPKGLRHGFGVACVAAKIPLTMIQKWMGHALIETTAIYLDVLGEEERALAKRLW